MRRRDRRGRARGPRGTSRRDRGRSGALVAGVPVRHRGWSAGRRRRDRGGRPAARHGGPGRARRRRTPGAAVERHPLRRLGPRAGRGARRHVGLGGGGRIGAAGGVHGHQAALARRARAGVRRPDHRGAAPPRLDHRAPARGRRAPTVAPGTATTDRGDASGTGYWSPGGGDYRDDLVKLALGHELTLPRVLGPERGRRHHGRRAPRLRRHRRQHGGRVRPLDPAGRRGRLARDQRHRLRRARPAPGRRVRHRRRVRGRDRAVPAAGLHAQRSARAQRDSRHARHRPRRAASGSPSRRHPAPAV